ncbi:TraB/GumN family protein [Halobium salinum]|uniref:TraB/GumN family protein n=1 Tax=Halobium salinum TaxID=1364940 RepID=A0ABD5PGB9_9EURY|nr:TraB/GumN family protein [Halobium salinum]
MSKRAESVADGGSVHVVGTAHVSAGSVREVEEVIDRERPEVVAVELDEGRYRQMQGETPDDLEPGDLLKGNTVFQFIAYWTLSYVQARLGEKFDIQPGADMLAAVETAEELGIDVALVDRDIQTTVQRFWTRLSTFEKLQMMGSLVFGLADPRIVGLGIGVFVGLFLGPIIGLFGPTLGLTDAVLLRAATGGVVGLGAGFLTYLVAGSFLGEEESLLAGAGVGVLAGGVGGAALGLGAGFVAGLGGFAVTALGSMTLGLTAGVLVGAAAGAAFAALGVGSGGEEIEEVDLDRLTDRDAVTVMMEEFREFSPGGAEALIDERDAFIAHRLLALREQGKEVVAVVGAGHRAGIERYLDDPSSLPPMESLVGEAKSRGIPWFKIIGVTFSLGFLAFFLLLAMAGVRNGFLLRLFGAWFLVNGLFAGGLAKLAGARWDSALVGGGLAWMTSVNPLLAPGWFSGYVELRHTAVNIADIGTLNELLSDEERPLKAVLSDMLDVPLFRLIMVVAMTNIGSMIGTALFAAYVLPLFGAELGGVDAVTRLMLDGARNSLDIILGALS